MNISHFQRLMKEIYFHRDSKRGKEKTMLWLVEEIGELAKAIRKDNREEMEEEFADVLAWLASLANIVNIDLQKAVLKYYPNVCKYCKNNPCICKK